MQHDVCSIEIVQPSDVARLRTLANAVSRPTKYVLLRVVEVYWSVLGPIQLYNCVHSSVLNLVAVHLHHNASCTCITRVCTHIYDYYHNNRNRFYLLKVTR